jgi:ketosteroid isomerase-like protein
MKGLGARFLLCLFVILSPQSTEATDSTLRPTLEARYAAMKSAMAAHDGEAIAALLSPDFVAVDISGRSADAAQMIREVSALPVDPLKVSTTTLLAIEVSGSTALVDQRYDMKTTKNQSDGSKQNVELIALSTDTWIDVGGVWLLQRTLTKQLDYFVNGQSVAHKTRTIEP